MTIIELKHLIDTVLDPRELFGSDPHKKLTEFRIISHPDKNPGSREAEDIFKKVSELYETLQKPVVELKSPKKGKYELLRLLTSGDVADIHIGKRNKKYYVVKASRIPGGAALLENEQKALSTILTKADNTTYNKYFPVLVESFPIRDKFQKRINVFSYQPGFVTLSHIRDIYKHGLPGRHIAWLFKRVITGLGFAHLQNIVHGAVTPDHILVDVANHGIQLLGWGHSVKPGERIRTISKRWKDLYPSEVMKKKGAQFSTDLYMTAKCLLYGVTDPPIERFMKSLLFESPSMRPDDAWKVESEFTELLRGVYGPPKFVELVI